MHLPFSNVLRYFQKRYFTYRNHTLVLLNTENYTYISELLFYFVSVVCAHCRAVPYLTCTERKECLLPESEEQSVTPEQVYELLKTCYDPCCKERAVSVVELGLIQNVKVAENGRDVQVELLLTSGWCPFSAHLLEMIDQTLHRIEGIGEVDTEIVWNTVWTPERMSASAKEKLTLPMAQLLPLRQRRLEREAKASQVPIS